MRVLGVELNSKDTIYVLLELVDSGFVVRHSNKLSLTATRSRDALVAFQSAIRTILQSLAPDIIAIKEKPEKGRMQAGAAALKMEGILLANAPCPSEFVSGARIKKSAASDPSLHVYCQPAFKAAAVVMSRVTKA